MSIGSIFDGRPLRVLFRRSDTAMTVDHLAVIAHTSRWVSDFVVSLNLCPFARRVIDADAIRYVVSEAATSHALLASLADELNFLARTPAIETSLLIHPLALVDFLAFNDILGPCDTLVKQLGFEGRFQVASFHPDYQFAGTLGDDAENFSNRSPYPMLHVLREASVTRAVASHPDVDSIPVNNIATLAGLGVSALIKRREACFGQTRSETCDATDATFAKNSGDTP